MNEAAYERNSTALPAILVGVAVGMLGVVSPLLAVGGVCVAIMARSPISACGMLILITPFTGIDLLNNNLLPFTGTKPYHLLGLLAVATTAFSLPIARRVPRDLTVMIVAFVGLFTVCVYRALPYVSLLADEGSVLSRVGFIRSEYIKPLIFYVPFVATILYCRTVTNLKHIVNYLAMATVGLALYVLFLYASELPNSPDVRRMTDVYEMTLALHRNGIGTLLMVGFPFLIARYVLTRSIVSALAILATVMAIGFLFSRSTYGTMILTPIIYLILAKRTKWIPVVMVVGGLGLAVASPIILERAMMGLDSGSADQILAGRLDHVWLPLIDEYVSDPIRLLFGKGRYAMVATEASRLGIILDAKHAHNLYLDHLLDSGIVGLTFVLYIVTTILRRFWSSRKLIDDPELMEYWVATAVAILIYLIAGMTGRSLFPNVESCFVWVAIGIAISIPLMLTRDSIPPSEGRS